MKCHGGVEFPSGKPCPKCGAKLGEVCWPGINADLLELVAVKKSLGRMVAAFKPFTIRPVGGLGSQVRVEQDEQIAAHAEASALTSHQHKQGK